MTVHRAERTGWSLDISTTEGFLNAIGVIIGACSLAVILAYAFFLALGVWG
jgi:hypothetical protein